ncbi:MAG: HPr family phosphocarrier protein [Firmicutes bacterium]|nr:HPr family phosphocarrier protein [Bacillota bacterium]
MKVVSIFLDKSNVVKDFVNTVNRFNYDVDLRSGRYVVDAKSLLGIFSLDLSNPITMEIHSDRCDDLLAALKPYLAK